MACRRSSSGRYRSSYISALVLYSGWYLGGLGFGSGVCIIVHSQTSKTP